MQLAAFLNFGASSTCWLQSFCIKCNKQGPSPWLSAGMPWLQLGLWCSVGH